MTAARKSSPECIASDKTPKLPVRATRKILSDTSRTAEPTDARAASRFSRVAFVEQQRRSDDGAGNAALSGTKRTERGSSEPTGGILHVGEYVFIVAIRGNIAQRTKLQAFDVPAADHFFATVGDINAIHHQRNSFTAGHTASDGADKVAEILLPDRGERRIVHAFDFQAPFMAVVMAGIEKFLF